MISNQGPTLIAATSTGSLQVRDQNAGTTTLVNASCNIVTAMTSSNLLTANTNRAGAAFMNNYYSTGSWYLSLGVSSVTVPTASTAIVGQYTVQLKPGDYYETPYRFTGSVFGICDAVSGTLQITEISN